MNYYEFLWHFEKINSRFSHFYFLWRFEKINSQFSHFYFFDLAYLGFDIDTVGQTDDAYYVWLYSRSMYDSFDNAVELAQMMLEEGWLYK